MPNHPPRRTFQLPEPEKPQSTGKIAVVSRALAGFRWLYMPFGLLALIAVGVHAAADVLDGHILWLVDHVDSAFDTFFGAWKLTAPLVDVVGLEQRVTIARLAALTWELAADVILALPALGYYELGAPSRPETRIRLETKPHPERSPWRALWDRFLKAPTTIRIVRPVASAGVVLSGACAVARMVQGSVYLSSRGLFGDSFAGLCARLLAIAVLGSVLYALGWRAVMQNLRHADEVSSKGRMTYRRAFVEGWIGSVIVLPLAYAAAVEAAPVASFFR